MNNIPHFKLKFKIEVLEKLQKGIPISQPGNHRTNFEEFQMIKMWDHPSNHKQNSNNSLPNSYVNSKNIGITYSKNKYSKYSIRNRYKLYKKYISIAVENLRHSHANRRNAPSS